MSVVQRILNTLFPPKCPVCGALTEGPFAQLCPDCTKKLAEELTIPCPLCGCTAEQCRCLPADLEPGGTSFHGKTHLCVGFYQPGKPDSVLSRLIYALKERSGDASAQILARMLVRPLMRLFVETGENPREWLLVYPPRSPAKKAETGFDHAERLTRILAKSTGAKAEHVFVRRGGSEQKLLGEEERRENIRRTMVLRHPVKCRDKKILLIDDVLTSGATLSYCAELLRKAGAGEIVCATVLKTLPRKQKKRPETDGKFWFEE